MTASENLCVYRLTESCLLIHSEREESSLTITEIIFIAAAILKLF